MLPRLPRSGSVGTPSTTRSARVASTCCRQRLLARVAYSRRTVRVARRLVILLAAILSACTSTTSAASSTRPAIGTSSPAPAPDAVPPELRGIWQTRLVPSGERTDLTLTERGYAIARGPNAGSGSVVVTAAEIRFFGGTICSGNGVYRWSLQGSSLRFTTVSEDCPGRAEALKDQTYQRIGS